MDVLYANRYLDAGLGATHAATFPNTVYVALNSGNPALGGNEVAITRAAVPNDGANWPAAASRKKLNGLDISFGALASSLGIATHFSVWDAAVGGNMVHSGLLLNPVSLAAGRLPVIQSGNLVITAT